MTHTVRWTTTATKDTTTVRIHALDAAGKTRTLYPEAPLQDHAQEFNVDASPMLLFTWSNPTYWSADTVSYTIDVGRKRLVDDDGEPELSPLDNLTHQMNALHKQMMDLANRVTRLETQYIKTRVTPKAKDKTT